MTNDETGNALAALEAVLDRERQALIDGDLEQLADLYEEKRTLVEQVNNRGDAEGETLRHVQEKALRNQTLLDNALQGIRSVALRMSTLHRIRQTLETYDETGQRRTIDAQPQGSMEKRA